MSDVDAADLVRPPARRRCWPVTPVDLASLEDLVLPVAALVEDLPIVRLLSLQPLAWPAGAW